MKYTHLLPKRPLLAIFTVVIALFSAPRTTHAAIFNAPEYIGPSQQSLGILGDVLLSNPSGEGMEAHFKQGVNQLVNAEGIIGFGSTNRKFRAGAQANINFFPDAPGQIGISLLTGGLLIRRDGYRALEFHLTPIVHKETTGFSGYPVNLFFGIPLSIELSNSHYKTGSQGVFGAQWDTNEMRKWFMVSEVGISFNNTDTYIALGIGTRFGASPRTSKDDKVQSTNIEQPKNNAPKNYNKVKTIEPENDENN